MANPKGAPSNAPEPKPEKPKTSQDVLKQVRERHELHEDVVRRLITSNDVNYDNPKADVYYATAEMLFAEPGRLLWEDYERLFDSGASPAEMLAAAGPLEAKFLEIEKALAAYIANISYEEGALLKQSLAKLTRETQTVIEILAGQDKDMRNLLLWAINRPIDKSASVSAFTPEAHKILARKLKNPTTRNQERIFTILRLLDSNRKIAFFKSHLESIFIDPEGNTEQIPEYMFAASKAGALSRKDAETIFKGTVFLPMFYEHEQEFELADRIEVVKQEKAEKKITQKSPQARSQVRDILTIKGVGSFLLDVGAVATITANLAANMFAGGQPVSPPTLLKRLFNTEQPNVPFIGATALLVTKKAWERNSRDPHFFTSGEKRDSLKDKKESQVLYEQVSANKKLDTFLTIDNYAGARAIFVAAQTHLHKGKLKETFNKETLLEYFEKQQKAGIPDQDLDYKRLHSMLSQIHISDENLRTLAASILHLKIGGQNAEQNYQSAIELNRTRESATTNPQETP